MNVTIDTQSFVKALRTVKPAVPPRQSSMPALNGVHLACNGDGRLHIRGSDLDTVIETSIPAQIDTPGEVVVSHRTLMTMVRGKGKVQLQVEWADKNKNVPPELTVTPVVTITGTITTISGYDPAEFPHRLDPPKGRAFVLPLDVVRRVLPAVGTDWTRQILTAMLFDGDRIVGTDSYRLHIERVPTARFPKFLMPRSGVEMALKARGPVTASVDFFRKAPGVDHRDASQIELRAADGTVYQLKAQQGSFPNYESLVPAKQVYWALFDRQGLLDALADVKRFVGDHRTPARLNPNPTKGLMDIVSVATDRGQTLATVPCTFDVPKNGAIPQIAFDPMYFEQAARQCESNIVQIGMSAPTKPATIIDGEDDRSNPRGLRLLMPVRVS